MPFEIASYLQWKGEEVPDLLEPVIVQEKESDLCISDADSDILFEAERKPLTVEEYGALKALALKSAQDFLVLYEAIPDRNKSCLPERKTFYGSIPRTAYEMYEQALSFGGKQEFGQVTKVIDHGDYKEVLTTDKSYQARSKSSRLRNIMHLLYQVLMSSMYTVKTTYGCHTCRKICGRRASNYFHLLTL